MSLDELQREIDRSFGDGPAHRPVEARIAAGRRAVVRRRVASGVAVTMVLAVAGTAYWATTPGETVGDGRGYVAIDPTPTPTPAPEPQPKSKPWKAYEVARYTDGVLELRDGVKVHQHIEDPYGEDYPNDALDVTFEGVRSWVILDDDKKGGTYSSSLPSNGWANFEAYVADQAGGEAAGEDGWPETMVLAEDGRVIPAPGVTVYNRTDDPQLGDSFADPGTTVGAAVVGVPGDQKSYFVVWRVIGGQLDVITTPPNDVVGATFEELLTYARSQYASGEGLR